MSYVLGQSNVQIPHVAGKTVSGADKRWCYFNEQGHRSHQLLGPAMTLHSLLVALAGGGVPRSPQPQQRPELPGPGPGQVPGPGA